MNISSNPLASVREGTIEDLAMFNAHFLRCRKLLVCWFSSPLVSLVEARAQTKRYKTAGSRLPAIHHGLNTKELFAVG